MALSIVSKTSNFKSYKIINWKSQLSWGTFFTFFTWLVLKFRCVFFISNTKSCYINVFITCLTKGISMFYNSEIRFVNINRGLSVTCLVVCKGLSTSLDRYHYQLYINSGLYLQKDSCYVRVKTISAIQWFCHLLRST